MRTFLLAAVTSLAACAPTPAPFPPTDAGPRADVPVPDAPRSDAPVATTTDGGAPIEALTSWTSTDVLADALARARAIHADAVVVELISEGVRADGTIDLTEGAPMDGRWTVLLNSPGTPATISIDYQAFDTGTAWPAITLPTYRERAALTVSQLPDSAVFVDQFRTEAGCTLVEETGLDISIYRVTALDAMWLQGDSGSDRAVFDVDASGTLLRSGCL